MNSRYLIQDTDRLILHRVCRLADRRIAPYLLRAMTTRSPVRVCGALLRAAELANGTSDQWELTRIASDAVDRYVGMVPARRPTMIGVAEQSL